MKTRIVAILIPLLIAALSVLGSERTADADSRGRGGGASVRGSGSHSGGGARTGGYGRGGGYSRGYSRYVSRGHSHGGHWSGSVWISPGWGFYDPYYYPYYPYPSYRYYAPTPQEPQEYILPESQQEEAGYWYYCKNPQGYYPYVERCPGGWMRVVPDTSPPDASPRDASPPDREP